MEDNMINMVITDSEMDYVEPIKVKHDMTIHREVSIRICKNCGRVYVLSDNDAKYFFKKYDNLPKKCPQCRAKNRGESVESNVFGYND